MNAIELLTSQHREFDDLFEEYEAAGEGATRARERVFKQIADALAIHSEIEEKIFYPEVRESDPELEDTLRESVEEHLSMKRIIADLLDAGSQDPQFDAKVRVLQEQVEHHVEEEEGELFPRTRRSCSSDQLDEMGARMEELSDDLEARGEAASDVPGQTDEAAPI
jgi:hemerythrin superfamily protein